MASRTLNPRFDHWCRIYRIVGGDELHDAETVEEIYEGKCMIYEANNLRSYMLNGAYKEDMGCDIPGLHEEIMEGDLIDYKRYSQEGFKLIINTPIPSRMGTTMRFNKPKI